MSQNDQELYEHLIKTFSTVLNKENVNLESKDSSSSNIETLIKDHIYSLLTKNTLSSSEISTLQALLQTVQINIRE